MFCSCCYLDCWLMLLRRLLNVVVVQTTDCCWCTSCCLLLLRKLLFALAQVAEYGCCASCCDHFACFCIEMPTLLHLLCVRRLDCRVCRCMERKMPLHIFTILQRHCVNVPLAFMKRFTCVPLLGVVVWVMIVAAVVGLVVVAVIMELVLLDTFLACVSINAACVPFALTLCMYLAYVHAMHVSQSYIWNLACISLALMPHACPTCIYETLYMCPTSSLHASRCINIDAVCIPFALALCMYLAYFEPMHVSQSYMWHLACISLALMLHACPTCIYETLYMSRF